jgi:spermidine synthase
MIPRVLIDTAQVPGDDVELRLVQRGDDFMIVLDRNELMSSRMSASEEALADLGCAHLTGSRKARVLIGGLGMGFTLRRALQILPADAEIVVAELVPKIVEWARGPLAHLFDGCLDDSRVKIVLGDVALGIGNGGWDAILLDVDNGPDGLTHAGNDKLYSPRGLQIAKAGLRPGGVLAIWSAYADAAFTKRLRDTGYAVDEQVVRARGTKGARHVIWLAGRR